MLHIHMDREICCKIYSELPRNGVFNPVLLVKLLIKPIDI